MNTIHLYFVDRTMKSFEVVDALDLLIQRAHEYRGVLTVGPSEYGVQVFAIGFRRCTPAFMKAAHKIPSSRRNWLL